MNIIKNFEDLKLLKSIPLDTVLNLTARNGKIFHTTTMQTAIL